VLLVKKLRVEEIRAYSGYQVLGSRALAQWVKP
jgi:hypothetical protein